MAVPYGSRRRSLRPRTLRLPPKILILTESLPIFLLRSPMEPHPVTGQGNAWSAAASNTVGHGGIGETILSPEHDSDSEEDDRRETSHDHDYELELESRCTHVCPGSRCRCRSSLTHDIYLPSLVCLRPLQSKSESWRAPRCPIESSGSYITYIGITMYTNLPCLSSIYVYVW